jgi:uncharacterized protein involved in tolerance to divalent cations
MIQLVIASKSKDQLEEIAEYLLTNHLVLSIDFHHDTRRNEFENGKIISYTIHSITGKSKSLLFSEIDLKIRNKYKDNIPEIYSIPITDMDWELANKLKSEIEKI